MAQAHKKEDLAMQTEVVFPMMKNVSNVHILFLGARAK